MNELIKVSVIIRTCNRPEVLKNALESIRKQIYKNIEVVVVEDGLNVSEELIKTEYSDLNILYRATMEKKGRTVAGNIGLSVASGSYLNFLDDDDILYSDHFSLLMDIIQKTGADAAYSIAEESQIIKVADQPYKFVEKRKLIRYQQPFNRLLLYSFNYLPIQSVLFSRKLYDECGGFDETLDVLEDWELWVRYSTVGNFVFEPKVTSKYYVPYRGKNKKNRGKELDRALAEVNQRFENHIVKSNVFDLRSEMDYVLNVYNQKGLIYYMKQVWNFFVYGDR